MTCQNLHSFKLLYILFAPCAITRKLLKEIQGSRLTFQLANPVASDRFDPLAKTNFSLARRRNLLL